MIDRNASEEEIIESGAKDAYAHECLIMGATQGYDTAIEASRQPTGADRQRQRLPLPAPSSLTLTDFRAQRGHQRPDAESEARVCRRHSTVWSYTAPPS